MPAGTLQSAPDGIEYDWAGALVTPSTVMVTVAGSETFPSESVKVNWKLSVPAKPEFAVYVKPPSKAGSFASRFRMPLLTSETRLTV